MKAIENLFSEQNKYTLKWITGGVLLFGFAYIANKIYRKHIAESSTTNKTAITPNNQSKTKTPNTCNAQRLNTKITEYSQYYFDKDMQIRNIEALISDNPTVEDIYLNSPTIASDQFIKYTYQIRKRRRLIRKTNQDQYVKIILMYESQIQELLLRSRCELIQQLGMDLEGFSHMQENYQTVQDLHALEKKSQQHLKYKLITDTKYKKISNQKINQIVKQQLCFMRNNMYQRLNLKLLQEKIIQDDILLIINTLLEDIIYQKFGYEKEDIERKIQEINYDTSELKLERRKMQKHIGGFQQQSSQSQADYEQQQQQIKQTKQSRLSRLYKLNAKDKNSLNNTVTSSAITQQDKD